MENNNKTTGVIVAIVALLAIGGGVLFFTTRNNDDSKDKKEDTTSQAEEVTQEPASAGTIVVVASDTPTLSTLVTAVKAASLVETLSGTGPYTVFAPTNEAFAALPAGTLDTLLMPENVDQLKSILTYHVVAGKVLSTDLKDGQVITTVQGENLTVSITGGMVYIIDAKGNKAVVEKADVNAENGVVHVIDSVLLPS